MTTNEFRNLREGDIVRHISSNRSHIITMNLGNQAIAIRTEHLTNPDEWKLILKAKYNYEE